MNATPARAPGILALLLALAVVFLIGGAVTYLLQGRGASGPTAVPVDALYSLALNAEPALAGDPRASRA